MQFIESSMIGVRSARLSFVSRTSPVRITLFPMIHVGEAAFYETTYNDALSHDVILEEGVNSPISARITRSYRWLIGSRAMEGLVVQPRLSTEGTSARIVHADLSSDEFAKEWRAVPAWLRGLVYVAAPLIGFGRRYSTRAKLAKNMACDDQPSLSELLGASPETGALTHAIMHARDARIIEKLGAELDAHPLTSSTLAVVYGAMHMRAVVREITEKRGYIPEAAQWRVIFSVT